MNAPALGGAWLAAMAIVGLLGLAAFGKATPEVISALQWIAIGALGMPVAQPIAQAGAAKLAGTKRPPAPDDRL